MVWHLRFDSDDDVGIPSQTIRNAGLGSTAWVFEVKGVVRSLPASGDLHGIVGSTLTTTSTGFCIEPDGRLTLVVTDSLVIRPPTPVVVLNELHTYRVERLVSGAVEFRVDGSLVHATTYSGGADFLGSRELNRLGKCRSGTTSSLRMDIEYISMVGFVNGQTWDSDLSGGTGTALPTTSSGNPFTLFGSTSWVPYLTNKPLKYWDGGSWVTKPLKYHNGTAWVTKPLKYHNGTGWS